MYEKAYYAVCKKLDEKSMQTARFHFMYMKLLETMAQMQTELTSNDFDEDKVKYCIKKINQVFNLIKPLENKEK